MNEKRKERKRETEEEAINVSWEYQGFLPETGEEKSSSEKEPR